MSDTAIKTLAIVCLLGWLLAGALAAFRHFRAAAGLNSALALLFLGFSGPRLLPWLADRQAYFQRRGAAAATADLQFDGGLAALAVASLVFGAFAFARYRRCIWPAWVANLPALALLMYFAFWFRIF